MSGKKKKNVAVPLEAFLSEDANWADVEDDHPVNPLHEPTNYSHDPEPERRGDGYPRGGRGDRYDDGPSRGGRGDRYDDGPRRSDRPRLPVPDRPPFVAFVGNLSYSATEQDIGDFFAMNCAVEQVRMIVDNDTGRSKGFGYITFGDKESLAVALEADGFEVCGRQIHVDVAEGRQSERGGPSKADAVDRWERGKTLPGAQTRAPRGDDRGRGSRFGEDRGPRRDEERRERKPLHLAPRTSTAPVGGPAKPKGPSPFGDAKPRDEAKFREVQKEREEKRRKEAEAAKAARKEREARKEAEAAKTPKKGGFRGKGSEGRDFSQIRGNMGQKIEKRAPAEKKAPKQAKPEVVQTESAPIPVDNIYSALKNQEA